MTKEIFSPATLPPPVGYSHIAKVNKGTLIYLAGQVSSDPSGKLVGEGNFEAQAEQVFRNVKIAVEAAGATMADIVKLNTYIYAVKSGQISERRPGEPGLVLLYTVSEPPEEVLEVLRFAGHVLAEDGVTVDWRTLDATAPS